MNNQEFTRRRFLQLSGLSSMSLLLGGCGTPLFADLVGTISAPLNQKFEELIFKPQKPVPEFLPNQIEPNSLIINSFESTPIIDLEKYRLIVNGEVNHPLSLSITDIQALPFTSMIIRHVCVEGWAAIVQWGGLRLREIITLAQPKSKVKYAYFQSADGYYESWDIASALHPQTLLAYQKNGAPLPVQNGAPLRLASPVKLGYKQSKWVTGITLTSELSTTQGYWEDRGYEWFAGL
ncbi:MAG: molybdopterin-dependent oxidoreductase [Aphanizomenon flos-aquae Clear-A1]|jgi:DMSO/TMAO reductase YedYZ molybdopterin-dependent catalytic subunit|nr:molybdopterin-dependent oxidoreductase [Aphanizomenon flos-aquae Clear-A1]NTW20259.1 molybdopterin-dependent oxidoreductase [Nostocales cyanobacterium W4_Combined_metabat2_030]QSV67702.1 MAG: molybdopterin-dependent oxidoreductase [Aphanizomenon flos-aquae DEX188]